MVGRLLLAAGGLACAGLVAWFVVPSLRAGDEPPPLTLLRADETADAGAEETRARRAALEARYPSTPIRAFPDTTLERAALPREQVERLYLSVRKGQYPYDRALNFRRRANLDETYKWPEHPAGAWTLRTNGAGFRMDAELGGGPYLLVAGDSHIDGACNNDETVPGLLAEALRTSRPELQVVNAACGGYSAHQYLGALELLCGDEPGTFVDVDAPVPVEALVVFVYGGNDFSEVLRLAHHFERTERPEGWGRENERLLPFVKTHAPAIGQALDSIVYFRNAEGEAESALRATLAVVEELGRHAARRDFRLLIAYLPSALEVERALHPGALDAPLAGLEVTDAELQGVTDLADRFLARAADLGVDTLDLRPTLSVGGPYYWDTDLHLNPTGHARVLEPVLEWFQAPASK